VEDFFGFCEIAKKKTCVYPPLTDPSRPVRVLSTGVQHGLDQDFLVFDRSIPDHPTRAHP
jgi:hypothetical protein